MNDEIQAAPDLLDARENLVDARQVEHVAWLDDLGPERLRKGKSAAAKGAVLITERKLGALTSQHPGNAPGDRAVVGDAHYEAALAGHQLS